MADNLDRKGSSSESILGRVGPYGFETHEETHDEKQRRLMAEADAKRAERKHVISLAQKSSSGPSPLVESTIASSFHTKGTMPIVRQTAVERVIGAVKDVTSSK